MTFVSTNGHPPRARKAALHRRSWLGEPSLAAGAHCRRRDIAGIVPFARALLPAQTGAFVVGGADAHD